MASGFKQATVDASKVAATLTNYPAFIDLSRIGITTQAEADSVRVYSDAAKTTELAREIVSVKEMHVKIPSLTTTTVIYVDYDGSRADYSVTDTYGRNAVWTGFDLVLHFENNVVDSTGNSTPSVVGSISYAAGQIGQGIQITDAAGGYVSVPDAARYKYTGNMYYSMWGYTSSASRDSFFSKGQPWTSATGYWMVVTDGTLPTPVSINRPATSYSGFTITPNTDFTVMQSFVFKKTAATNMKTYQNGSLLQTTTTNATANFTTNSNALFIGRRTDSADLWNGIQDEVRFSATLYDDDWIETENNNHSDEPSFWGTWTDVSTFTPQAMWFM